MCLKAYQVPRREMENWGWTQCEQQHFSRMMFLWEAEKSVCNIFYFSRRPCSAFLKPFCFLLPYFCCDGGGSHKAPLGFTIFWSLLILHITVVFSSVLKYSTIWCCVKSSRRSCRCFFATYHPPRYCCKPSIPSEVLCGNTQHYTGGSLHCSLQHLAAWVYFAIYLYFLLLLAVSPLFRSACQSINSALSFPTWSNSKSNVLFCIWQRRSCLFHSWWRAGSFMLSSRRLQSKTRISPRPAGVHPQDGELTGEADMFCVSFFFFLKCGCISFSVPFTNSSSMRNMYIKQSYKPPNFGNF